MPSRKKVQGRVKKAEKKLRRAYDAFQWFTKLNPGNHSKCGHIDPPSRFTEDDVVECHSLLVKMIASYVANSNDFIEPILDFCETYRREIYGNTVKMDLFRVLLLSLGTKFALEDAQVHETDLLAWEQVELPTFMLHMLLAIEELVKYGNSDSNCCHSLNSQSALFDKVWCPREAIKYFHRYVMSWRSRCICSYIVLKTSHFLPFQAQQL
jgi:hypothetical protein